MTTDEPTLVAREGLDTVEPGLYVLDEPEFIAENVYDPRWHQVNSGRFRWIARVEENGADRFRDVILKAHPKSYVRPDGKLVVIGEHYLGPVEADQQP